MDRARGLRRWFHVPHGRPLRCLVHGRLRLGRRQRRVARRLPPLRVSTPPPMRGAHRATGEGGARVDAVGDSRLVRLQVLASAKLAVHGRRGCDAPPRAGERGGVGTRVHGAAQEGAVAFVHADDKLEQKGEQEGPRGEAAEGAHAGDVHDATERERDHRGQRRHRQRRARDTSAARSRYSLAGSLSVAASSEGTRARGVDSLDDDWGEREAARCVRPRGRGGRGWEWDSYAGGTTMRRSCTSGPSGMVRACRA